MAAVVDGRRGYGVQRICKKNWCGADRIEVDRLKLCDISIYPSRVSSMSENEIWNLRFEGSNDRPLRRDFYGRNSTKVAQASS